MGPFQMMVFAAATVRENASTVRGPISNAITWSPIRSVYLAHHSRPLIRKRRRDRAEASASRRLAPQLAREIDLVFSTAIFGGFAHVRAENV